MEKLIIVGNKTAAEIIYEHIKIDPRYTAVSFSVDKEYIKEKDFCGLPVTDLKELPSLYPPEQHKVLLAVGYTDLNRTRESLFKRTKEAGYEPLTYIHPSASVFTEKIGSGSIIMPGAVIDPFVSIGDNTVVWDNCTVAHHSVIENNCWIASGSVISGDVHISNNTFIGLNATVVNYVRVGSYNIIGAGTLITKNTVDHEVYLSRQSEKFRLTSEEYIKFTRI